MTNIKYFKGVTLTCNECKGNFKDKEKGRASIVKTGKCNDCNPHKHDHKY